MDSIILEDIAIPRLGFGTWKLEGTNCENSVLTALETGYRHVDTAQAYGNEEFVGRALAHTDVPRDEIFLTTKVWADNFETVDTATESINRSLEKLNTDYVDMLLVHWPFKEYAIEHLIAPLIKAKQDGKTRLIGVSNFTIEQMDMAHKISDGQICNNQVEYHPLLNQQPLIDWTKDYGWALTAYSPLGRGNAVENELIQGLAEKYNKTPAQIILHWFMQQDNVMAIPKSGTDEHIKSNFDIWDFQLTKAEMDSIFALRNMNERNVDPDFAPEWDVAA